jgi:hypothetical protein
LNLKLILIVAVAALAGFAVSMFLGYKQIKPFDVLYNMVAGYMVGFDAKSVISNPASLIGMAGTGLAVAAPLLSMVNSAKQKAQQVEADAKTQIGGLSTSLDSATGKLDSTNLQLTNAQTTITNLNTTQQALQAKLDSIQPQYDKLQNQYSELQKIRAADVIGSLSGGTTIINPDGSKTAVVTKTVIK